MLRTKKGTERPLNPWVGTNGGAPGTKGCSERCACQSARARNKQKGPPGRQWHGRSHGLQNVCGGARVWLTK